MKPSKPRSDSIAEIDGIQFEAAIVDSMVKVPPKQPDARTDVEFGIKITNCRETALQFLLFFLMPQFFRVDDKKIPCLGFNANGTWSPERSDIYPIAPGETQVFLVKGTFVWREDKLVFSYPARDGRYWSFGNFEPEVYKINILYAAPNLHQPEPLRNLTRINRTENVWEGEVSVPIWFRLVQD